MNSLTPWKMADLDYRIIEGPDGLVIADVRTHPGLEDARRIVACVNACEGIETKYLEHASVDFGKELRAENNALRAALERLGSMEAFEGPRTIKEFADDELIARIDFARATLLEKQP